MSDAQLQIEDTDAETQESESPLLSTDEVEEQAYTAVPGFDDEEEPEEEPETTIETTGFAILGTSMYAQYMPQIMSSVFRYRESRLVGLPADTIQAVKELNKQIESSFNIDSEQQKEIQKSLDSYLKTVNFSAPSPLTQLILVASMPILGGAFMAMNLKKEIDRIVSDAISRTSQPKEEKAA